MSTRICVNVAIMAVYIRGQGSVLGAFHRVGQIAVLTKANLAYPPIILGHPDTFVIQGVVKKRLEESFE
jgi:hypothetical protein